MTLLSPLPNPPSDLSRPAGPPPSWPELPSAAPPASAAPSPALRILPDFPPAPEPAPPVFPVFTSPPLPTSPPAPEDTSEETLRSGILLEDYTDDDLRQALAPLIHGAVHARESTLHRDLEPMLRATVRRSLAEYSPGKRPFLPPSFLDRFLWRLKALFTSRSYEDVLFEKTHRFQIDEVFALDSVTLALISHASCDPARHSSAKRVHNTAHRLADRLRDAKGHHLPSFSLPEHRTVISRTGRHLVLLAVVRGKPNELLVDDLQYALDRIEEKFRGRFQPDGTPLLHALQPFLEDCLLIQAPASAA